MSLNEWFGIVGGIVSIVAFIFSVWIWLQADMKIRELRGVIQSTYEISGTVMWEMTTLPGEGLEAQLRQAQRSLGLVSAVHTLASRYIEPSPQRLSRDLDGFLERGVIWTTPMLWNVEASEKVKEVWLVSPDLEPDISDPDVGAVVRKNLQAGTRYVYFMPRDLGDLDELKEKLFTNLGLIGKAQRLAGNVTFVAMDRTRDNGLFHRGNSILLFEGNPVTAVMHALEEIVFTKVSSRGLFWQEHPRAVAERLRQTLRSEISRVGGGSDAPNPSCPAGETS